jgi:sigma-B regulation protein RsbU (phosphoserine phosphatase)
VLGPLPDAAYRRSFANVRPGEVLVMFSDGLIERQNAAGEEFGVERLVPAVQAVQREHADRILATLFDTVRSFGADGPWRDDVTVFVVRRLTAAEYHPRSMLDTLRRDGQGGLRRVDD